MIQTGLPHKHTRRQKVCNGEYITPTSPLRNYSESQTFSSILCSCCFVSRIGCGLLIDLKHIKFNRQINNRYVIGRKNWRSRSSGPLTTGTANHKSDWKTLTCSYVYKPFLLRRPGFQTSANLGFVLSVNRGFDAGHYRTSFYSSPS